MQHPWVSLGVLLSDHKDHYAFLLPSLTTFPQNYREQKAVTAINLAHGVKNPERLPVAHRPSHSGIPPWLPSEPWIYLLMMLAMIGEQLEIFIERSVAWGS